MSAPLQAIASALEFSIDDLALNRTGRLSPEQSWQSVRLALGSVGLLLALAGAFLFTMVAIKPKGAAKLGTVACGVCALAVFGAFTWGYLAGAVARRVEMREGPLDLFGAGRGGMNAVVDRTWVPISTRALEVLTKGERVRVYFLAHSKQFLSIEPRAGTP